jgi:iron(III) transport system ATP-binding protein
VTGLSAVNDAEPTLRVQGLTRRFGDIAVVDDVWFDVSRGELITLVGPSGCGKSTLLRTIAGLEVADAGTVRLEGRDVTHTSPERRRVGLVFQEHALFGHLRVEQNIAFGLRDLPRTQRRQRVADLLDVVRLSHVARRFPHELSGGEQQRIALARALAPRPAVVLLDEPFASLDELLRDEVRRDVTRILADQGTTAVLVTHDRSEALTLGHRVAVMARGRLVQCDTPEAVYERPVDRFVAEFLATTTLLPQTDGTALVARPHDLAVRRGGSSTVVERSYLGAMHRYRITTAEGDQLLADHEPDGPLDVGDACHVDVVADHPLHRIALDEQ